MKMGPNAKGFNVRIIYKEQLDSGKYMRFRRRCVFPATVVPV